jgi:Domain of unknown function (DUF6259)
METSRAATPVRLEAPGLCLAFDRETGAIVEFGDRPLGLSLNQDRAESWRLMAPLPERRGHYVSGRGQRLRDLEEDDGLVRLRWGPIESEVGTLEIDVTMEVRIVDGEARFRTSIENRSHLLVEELVAPCLAGMMVPPDRDAWRMIGPRVISGAWEYPVFDTVPCSFHGPRKPFILHPYPGGWTHDMALGMPWIALEHESGRGLYFANRDDAFTFSCALLEFDSEMRIDTPSSGDFGSVAPQRWPMEAGEDSTLALAWTAFPFAAPGESFEGPEIVLRALSGGWREAAEHFGADLESRVGRIPRKTTWLAESDGWVATAMMFNDGTIRRRVEDLPQVAANAAEVGVSTILLMGWNVGGLDGGYPNYTLDPRLGTDDEFRAALAACREQGVRVVLMGQIQQICAETEWFREEGHRYLVQNPSGDPYYGGGVHYGFNTVLDHLGFSAPQILTANPAHPEFRKHVMRQLGRIVEYGADGVLLDKLHTGDPYSLDYNPALPGTPATRFHRGLAEAIQEFAEQVATGDDFAIVGECSWDRAMPYCEATFSRYFEREHLPVQELAFPDVRLSTTMVGDTDTQMVNNALRNGHAVCLEAHWCHGEVGSLPRLGLYLKEVFALRRRLRSILWHGRPADPRTVGVQGDDVLFNVFRPRRGAATDEGPELAVVLNHFEDSPRQATIALPGAGTAAAVHRPFKEQEIVSLPATLDVPVGEYVVVVPERA